MKMLLRLFIALGLVIGLFAAGAANAMDLLTDARLRLEKNRKSEVVFLAGSATANQPTAFVLLAAGDILLEAGESELAKSLLVRALATAEGSDVKLLSAIKNSLDRVAKQSHESKIDSAPNRN